MIMVYFSIAIWVVLLALSVLACANLANTWFVNRQQRQRVALELEKIGSVNAVLEQLYLRLQREPEEAQSILNELTELRAAECLEFDGLIAEAIDLSPVESIAATLSVTAAEEVRGMHRISGLIVRGAPLVGMIGTLIGLKMMFENMGDKPGEMAGLFSGFSFCLSTTLAGAAISLLGLFAQKVFLEGGLESRVQEILGALRTTRSLSREIRASAELAARLIQNRETTLALNHRELKTPEYNMSS